MSVHQLWVVSCDACPTTITGTTRDTAAAEAVRRGWWVSAEGAALCWQCDGEGF